MDRVWVICCCLLFVVLFAVCEAVECMGCLCTRPEAWLPGSNPDTYIHPDTSITLLEAWWVGV